MLREVVVRATWLVNQCFRGRTENIELWVATNPYGLFPVPIVRLDR